MKGVAKLLLGTLRFAQPTLLFGLNSIPLTLAYLLPRYG